MRPNVPEPVQTVASFHAAGKFWKVSKPVVGGKSPEGKEWAEGYPVGSGTVESGLTISRN
jgi:hypothetical protein